jgi:hypothetical protein
MGRDDPLMMQGVVEAPLAFEHPPLQEVQVVLPCEADPTEHLKRRLDDLPRRSRGRCLGDCCRLGCVLGALVERSPDRQAEIDRLVVEAYSVSRPRTSERAGATQTAQPRRATPRPRWPFAPQCTAAAAGDERTTSPVSLRCSLIKSSMCSATHAAAARVASSACSDDSQCDTETSPTGVAISS